MPRPIRAAFNIPYGAAFGAARAGGARRHNGTDYHCPIGTPIYGTEEGGRVTSFGYNGDPWIGSGHWVTVTYPSGHTTDMHMRERTRLAKDAPVGTGTVIGYVGLTGNAVNASPPGSHLHHERRKPNGLLVNPEAFYANSSVAGGGITEIDEMSAAGEATIIKLLSEIHQPLLNGALEQIGRIDKNTGETHQAIYETDQWEGINARLGRIAAAVEGGKPATVQVDVAALAATLAPLLKTGATVADIEAALKDDFANIPAATRAAIIKE